MRIRLFAVLVHVVSISPRLFNYDLPDEPASAAAREVNDEIAGMVKQRPKRFGGLATIPLPHVKAAVAELERARKLGHLGAMVNTHILGRNWDEPEFEPIFRAAQDLDALLFFHPDQPLVGQRINRYHLGNTSGNVLEDSLTIAVIIFSGLLDKYPKLKLVVAHGGGPIAFGIDRMDRGWEVRPEARVNIPNNRPSSYLRRFYVDDITWGEASLRFLIDRIGSDRVVLGSDWPYDMGPDNPVQMLTSMESITKDEKERILHGNLEELLGI